MKKICPLVCMMLFACCSVRASDFWETYSKKLTYNYSVKSGSIPAQSDYGRRLSNDEMLSVLTKSFSQALGERLTVMAEQRSYVAIICIFHPEPEKCFADHVIGATFNEVHFVNAPGVSQKLMKKLSRYYSYTLNEDDDNMNRRDDAAQRVPQRKKFNPRFGFDLNEPEIMITSPFYSFKGVYIEPRYGTSRGPSLSLMYECILMDIQQEGVSLKYRTTQQSIGRGYIDITIRPEGEIYISNEFIIR